MRARTILGLIVIAAVAAVAFLYWPANLGGRTTYVGTHGSSMLPRFHPGDLAVVQPASSYKVGDIAAYHSATLHGATVMHRIIATDGHTYTFKGDNNPSADLDHPTNTEILGKLEVRIPHGAAIRSTLGKPYVLFPFLAISIIGAGSGFFVKRSRRNRKGERVPARMPREHRPQSQPVPRDRVRTVIPVATAIAVVGCLVVAVMAWNTPEASGRRNAKQRYDHNLALSYSEAVPQSTAYPDGVIHTGDTVYQKIATRIEVNVASDFVYKGSTNINGTYDLVANVSGGNGLHGSIPLATKQPLTTEHAHMSAPLDITAVRDLIGRFGQETGLGTTSASVEVVASVHGDALIDHQKVALDNSAKIAFSYTPIIFGPAAVPGAPSHDNAAPVVATKSGVVGENGAVHSGTISFWVVKVPVQVARVGAIFAMALVLGAAAIAARLHRRQLRGGELNAIESRYRRYLVSTPEIPVMRDRAVIEVASMNVLVKLAEAQAEVILHASTDHGEDFAVVTDSALYVYGTARRVRSRLHRVAAA
jgi:signal peptidase I